uniref:Uncharacterized protein n=1 Tax=Nothobranchius rachovii TaxID=451742 RepID=A0A1A8RAM5_9TELE
MEQNTKERKTTMMLVKRAKLAQELAELDALLNSQLDSPHNVGSRLSSQPLLSSDNSVLKKSMTNDTSDCGQLALKRLKTVSSAFATTSSVSHESGNQLVESSHKKSLRKKQATIYMETCSDWSDCTDYSDADYAPDSEESSAQDEDACLYPTAKKPLRSLRYPLLSPVKQDDGSESSIGEKWPKVLRRGPQALLQRESSLLTVQIAMCPLQRKVDLSRFLTQSKCYRLLNLEVAVCITRETIASIAFNPHQNLHGIWRPYIKMLKMLALLFSIQKIQKSDAIS